MGLYDSFDDVMLLILWLCLHIHVSVDCSIFFPNKYVNAHPVHVCVHILIVLYTVLIYYIVVWWVVRLDTNLIDRWWTTMQIEYIYTIHRVIFLTLRFGPLSLSLTAMRMQFQNNNRYRDLDEISISLVLHCFCIDSIDTNCICRIMYIFQPAQHSLVSSIIPHLTKSNYSLFSSHHYY